MTRAQTCFNRVSRAIPRLTCVCVAAILGLGGMARMAPAQETQAGDPSVPLVVVNVASVERLLNQAVVTFEAAGRPELSEAIGGALARVNDLKGLNRSRSMGLMIFLNGFTANPIDFVGFVPVKNMDELLETVETGPVTTNKVGDDRYEIEISVPRQKLHVKVQGDYAFVGNSTSAIDRNFADPVRITGRLSNAYDIAVSLNLKSITQGNRDLFLNLMRANAENDLQRRDNEPESVHRIRRAAGMRNLELLETVISQGEQLTLGWAVSGENKTAGLEVVMTATKDSDFAKYFNELKGSRSMFANLLKTDRPLTGSISWKLDKPARKMFKEIIATAELELTRQLLTEDSEKRDDNNPIRQLARVLNAMADNGHADMAVQFVGQPPGPFVLVGGIKVANSDTLVSVLGDILGRLKGKEGVEEIKLNAIVHKGVPIHRLEFSGTRPQGQRLFGESPMLYLGVGDNVFWFAYGGDEAPLELKRAIDKVAEPIADSVSAVPIQFVMNFASWMDIFDPDNRTEGIAELARKSFAKGGDALRIEVRPIDDGVKFRLHFDEAFVRLVGQQIARQLDREEGQ